MKKSKTEIVKPEDKEAKRIADIKKLSYAQRLEHFLHLLELSHALKNAPKIYPTKK